MKRIMVILLLAVHIATLYAQEDDPVLDSLALKTSIIDDKLWITIDKYDPDSYPGLFLVIHSNGLPIYAKEWDPSKEYITFDTSVFPSGISHIVLLTKDLQIISNHQVSFIE